MGGLYPVGGFCPEPGDCVWGGVLHSIKKCYLTFLTLLPLDLANKTVITPLVQERIYSHDELIIEIF